MEPRPVERGLNCGIVGPCQALAQYDPIGTDQVIDLKGECALEEALGGLRKRNPRRFGHRFARAACHVQLLDPINVDYVADRHIDRDQAGAFRYHVLIRIEGTSRLPGSTFGLAVVFNGVGDHIHES